MNHKILLGAGLLLFISSLVACQKEDPNTITYDCSNLTLTYTNDIKSIIDNNCARSGCHNASSRASGIDLSSYANVSSEADKPRFRGAIERLDGFSSMPKGGGKLSIDNLQKIYCWIESGKPQ